MFTLHDHLCVRKWCAWWISHSLTEGQWQDKAEWAKFMLRKFNGGCSKLTRKVITGDQTWIYWCDLEAKMQLVIWLGPLWMRSHPQNSKDHAMHEENGCLCHLNILLCWHHSFWGQSDSHCGLVCAPLSAECLQGVCQCCPKTGLHGLFFTITMPVHTQK